MKDIMTFPLDEQETTVSFMRGDKEIEVYSSDSTMITKLLKITDNYDILTTDKNGRITSGKFRLDSKQISFRRGRELTEEQRKEIGRKLTEARLNK